MDKIKVVIWDLDETFWKGTLSEEGAEIVKSHAEIVKILNRRGIVNSIVSKNDFNQAKNFLKIHGLWSEFVFPVIEWKPKGPLIKELLDRMNLRSENALFLDDNHHNRNEALHFNPKLNVRNEKFINQILEHPSLQGKSDFNLSRLKQYKILEKREVAKKNYDNETNFLYQSGIKAEIIEEINSEYIERIYELIERTNQLNFTKIRLTKSDTIILLNNPNYRCGIVRVWDNYGDYGIVGFFALDITANSLSHFLFSCRIINLGIEQYIYYKLGFPKIELLGDTVTKLSTAQPDWISLSDSSEYLEVGNDSVNKIKVLFKGGCDLSQMTSYLNRARYNIIEETNYVSKETNFPIHNDNITVLQDGARLDDEMKQILIGDRDVPFVDDKFYHSAIFEYDYDVLVYSPLMDYTQEIYSHSEFDVDVPMGGYFGIWTDETEHKFLRKYYRKKGLKVTKSMLENFAKKFKHKGQLRPEKFKELIMELRDRIPRNIPLIFLNGAELPSPDIRESHATKRHIIMNKALEEVLDRIDNVFLVDVRETVRRSDCLKDNIRHYKRESYSELAMKLDRKLLYLFPFISDTPNE